MSLTYVHSERGFWRRALQLLADFPVSQSEGRQRRTGCLVRRP